MVTDPNRTPLQNTVGTLSVSGKSVLITGGTTGIGRATARRLVTEGANIFILGRHAKELEDALRELKTDGLSAGGTIADITKPADIQKAFTEIEREFGGLDILINNAGLPARSIQETAAEDIQYVVNTNLTGYLLCAREAVLRMEARSGGQIVNIGSMSSEVKEKGASLYVATKAGVEGFTVALRKEVNALGIRVILIEPGSVSSDMAGGSPEEQHDQEAAQKILKAEDIAECVYFALTRPLRMDVVKIQVRPHLQEV